MLYKLLGTYELGISFRQFFEYDWTDLEAIDLVRSGLTDEDWKILVSNADLMPNLAWIWIRNDILIFQLGIKLEP